MLADEIQQPSVVREQVAQQVKEMVGAAEVFFFKYARVNGVNHYTGVTGALDADTQEVFARLEGQPTLASPFWRPTRVPADQRNRFQRVSDVLADLERSESPPFETLYGPLEITRSCRTLLFDGPRFIGYVGCVRRGAGARDFSDEEVARLDRFAQRLKTELLSAERLDPELSTPACGVFDRDRKKLDWASPDVRAWFTNSRVDHLCHVLRQDELPAFVVLDDRVVRFCELDGEQGTRVMVSLERSEDPRLELSAPGLVADELAATLDRLPSAALIVSSTLEIHCLNRQARRLLASCDVLRVRRGRLQPEQPSVCEALEQAVADAAAPADRPDTEPSHCSPQVVSIRRGARLPLDLLAVPLCASYERGEEPSVLLMLYDPESRRHIDPVLLERLFDLTPTEAFVAARLAEGNSITEIAQQRRCSRSTVRTHVKHIFQKTHTNRQGELVQLLLTSPAISFRG